MPPASVVVEDGTRQLVNGETFWFERQNEFWWLLRRLTKGKTEIGMSGITDGNDEVREANVMNVSQAQWETVDFLPANIACSEDPDSTFVKKRMLNLRRKDGHIALTDNLFTVVKDGVKESREVSEEEAMEIIKNEFGLVF